MNKRIKIIIASIIAIIVAIIAVALLTNLLSYKAVSFSLSNSVDSAEVYEKISPEDYSDTKKVGDITYDSKLLKLKNGNYYIVPKGNNIDTSPILFHVDNNMAVEVNPGYSSEYLSKTLDSEFSIVSSIIKKRYPSVSNYIVDKGKLYENGAWYATTIHKDYSYDPVDVYRTVLKKENEKWSIVASPNLVINYNTNKSIPKDIIYDINQAPGDL